MNYLLRTPFLWPLFVLGLVASMATSSGLQASIPQGSPAWLATVLALALHVVWISALAARRAWWAGTVAFLVCWTMADRSSGAPGYSHSFALVIEVLLAGLAFALSPPQTLAARLARWRTAQNAITAQALLAEGALPWLRRTLRHLAGGRAIHERPVEQAVFAAEMEDAQRAALVLYPDGDHHGRR